MNYQHLTVEGRSQTTSNKLLLRSPASENYSESACRFNQLVTSSASTRGRIGCFSCDNIETKMKNNIQGIMRADIVDTEIARDVTVISQTAASVSTLGLRRVLRFTDIEKDFCFYECALI